MKQALVIIGFAALILALVVTSLVYTSYTPDDGYDGEDFYGDDDNT